MPWARSTPTPQNESVRRIRVYAGYAGWAAGQLDSELEQEAWVVMEPESGDPFSDGDIWAGRAGAQGGSYRLLATMPADPSLN